MAVEYTIDAKTFQKYANQIKALADEHKSIGGFATGGFVPARPDGDYPFVYTTPNTTTFYYSPRKTVTYTFTDAEGRKTTVEAEILGDGTIHIDPEAFTIMMEALGYVKDA